ncbi:cell division protein ZapA [Aureibacter tunicatorum]|uniref:Cell division protein ZapA n=1 Tax=Aureibacter tunicatorum TaxID=866807 RepID=A0AAE3XP82_9BACT|nr:cell division protein ZapA [Aureibacter tunicatorum]MDR6240183.1 cell division protein ZapA [Aureibacter tunicatorum]BDD05936.1 cell division protein ZapA [Aureibacter tunicatorum]
MEKLSIKIKIGDREYPMRVRSEEEELVRLAGKQVNDKLKFFKQQFKLDDRQDLLAMAAFDAVVEKLKLENNKGMTEEVFESKLDELNKLLSDNI